MSRILCSWASAVYRALGFACCLILISFLWTAAQAHSGEYVVSQSVTVWPLVPVGEALKEKPEHPQIYQVDDVPLGDRRPLLLIHGGGSEHLRLLHWDKVLARFDQDVRFMRSFKVYMLRYDSTRLLEDVMPDAKTAVTALYENCGQKPLTILAESMGGNIAELGMEDSAFEQAVERVIAMGTPFHGSPLFSADWFQYSLYKSKFLPFFRTLDSIDYRVYFSWHKNYQQDLKWDDSDDLVPQVGAFKSRAPFGPKGILTVKRDTSDILAIANEDRQINKKKFITYAGYLLNGYVLGKERDRLRWVLLSPFRFLSTQVRAQTGGENAALLVLNREISKIDAGPAGSELGKGEHVYALNDGITPVSSAIFLPDKVCKTHLLLRETDLLGIAPLVDVGKARVFRNIDHVTFIEGKPPHHGSPLLRDSLHPEEGLHAMFDWILSELLQVKPNELDQHAEAVSGHPHPGSTE